MNTGEATIIIRSANERTEQLCKKLILEQGVKEENLFIVREVPFSESMRKSFKIGINNRLPWTFCVDADVLLRPGSIEYMIKSANSQKTNVCEVQGLIMDKFFGGPRRGGIHLYRTSLLKEVIKRIPNEGVSIRPERYTLGKMAEAGFPWKKINYIVGVHDEEQFNYDIYRKSFVQATKHLYRAELFITLWKEKINIDHDYKVALKGFLDGIKNYEEVYIDSNQTLYKDLFTSSGLPEKNKIELGDYSLDRIENIINNWEYSEIYYKFFPDRDGLDSTYNFSKRKIKDSINKNGYTRTFSIIIANLFLKLGKRILNG